MELWIVLAVTGAVALGVLGGVRARAGRRSGRRGRDVGQPLRVCLFGTYDRVTHPRIAILEAGLRAAGAEVVEANVPLWESGSGGTQEKVRAASNPLQPRALLRMVRVWVRLARRYRQVGPHDVVLVGYMGHLDVHLARLLAGRTPVVLDMFLSVYDTVVLDRRLVAPGSAKARVTRLIDRWAVRASRLALLDTPAHRDFVVDELGAARDRVAWVPVGAEPDRFQVAPPAARTARGPLRVLFYGSFIPLHGTVTLAAAIRLLHGLPVVFTVVGRGQERAAFDAAVAGVDGLDVRDWVEYDQLPALLAEHDVVLGIFGTTGKALRVVPNKVYQAACVGRAVVTGDTPALRAAFVPDEEAVLVTPGDADALAAALRGLAEDRGRVAELGRRARARFEAEHDVPAIGARLVELLTPLVGGAHSTSPGSSGNSTVGDSTREGPSRSSDGDGSGRIRGTDMSRSTPGKDPRSSDGDGSGRIRDTERERAR